MRTKQRAGVVMMLLGISLIFSVKVFASSEDIFTDVNQTTKYQEAIEYLKNQGVVQGYENGSFQPENKINRAEFLKILIEGTGNSNLSEEDYNDCFSDVTDEWFAKYTCYAKEQGIVSGYADKSFRPGENINFAEAAKMIVNVFALEKPEDTEIWYESYVQALTENKKVPRTVVGFDYAITRGEMAEMVWRVREEVEKSEDWVSYKGMELKNKNGELFSEKYRSVSGGGGNIVEMEEFEPLKFWESEISEIEYIFYCFDAAECRVFRTLENDDFKIELYAVNAEGATSPRYALIKDKKNDKYFISNKSIIEVQFDNSSENLFLSWGEPTHYYLEDVTEPKLSNFSNFINTSVDEIKENVWDNNGMSFFVANMFSLAKISLNDFSVKNHFISFGGEEIKIEENKISFTRYGLLDRYKKFPYDKGTLESCWMSRNYHEYCDELKIPVITLDINTFKKLSDSSINQIGALHEFDFTSK